MGPLCVTQSNPTHGSTQPKDNPDSASDPKHIPGEVKLKVKLGKTGHYDTVRKKQQTGTVESSTDDIHSIFIIGISC